MSKVWVDDQGFEYYVVKWPYYGYGIRRKCGCCGNSEWFNFSGGKNLFRTKSDAQAALDKLALERGWKEKVEEGEGGGMSTQIPLLNEPKALPKKLSMLYTPSGRAGEYANHGYACNLYWGCPHGCIYCYAPACLHMDRAKFRSQVVPIKDALKRLEKDLQKVGKLDEPIFLCFSCDPYPSGVKNVITRSAITLIKTSGNNVRILTKSSMDARLDFDLLDSNDEFGISLTGGEQTWREWEPGAGNPYGRIDSLEIAHKKGIKTWVSFEPVIYPVETLSLIRRTSFADIRKIGKLNYHPHAKTIDWRKFAQDASALCESLGLNYVLKEDLKAYLEVPNG